MTDKPKFMMQTYIRCSQDALWDALTDPDQFQHYDFLEQTAKRTDDKVTYFMPDGTVTLYTTDIEVTPKSKLVTSFEPTWAPDAPPSRITYEIAVEGEFCCLTVLHEDLNNDPSDGTGDGWVRSIAGLKTYLETGKPAHFGGAYLMEGM
ncbi:Activator of Hsp90 ATPase homolog 1-like protein [Yoonia tamlensis]|uniref:Activator of Hsp90 ATPase homolog 1-like protein n=1 Tax=Yoonia tamlensis TaxID=390270 RepID=A0A1I6FZE9_9RHOB|nr:SRPBCC domain-containing protein [Yoonia tamlensis]SFR35318.1 Activator of Hsp90 ATPase homolog 1-like protein [Yoonia tamlensis]